jgi:hypothetical protein
MSLPKHYIDQLKRNKKEIDSLFKFVQSEPVSNLLLEFETAVTSAPSQEVNLDRLIRTHKVVPPRGIQMSVIGDCFDFCIGDWCPIHYKVGEGFGRGRC